jgi:transcriptional regulator with XRE-family HTH domain
MDETKGRKTMVEEDAAETGAQLPLEGVGQRLRRAREAQAIDLADMAQRTRISLRYLESIEGGTFEDLPARTYALGFTRTYARELGLDENKLIDELRRELSDGGSQKQAYTPAFEPGDPAKVPPVGLIWISAIAAVILAIGAYAFYARFFAPGADPEPLVAQAEPPAPLAQARDTVPPATPTAAAPDEVVFTALEEGVWVSFYEAGGRRLEQKLMAQGEQFVVPQDARDPRIWTGRPDAFAITIGGQSASKLAEDETVIRDVVITAEALRARVEPQINGSATADGTAADALPTTG